MWHASICSGCEAYGRGREHVGCFHAAGQWLEAVRHILNIALQLQESCCRHMGCPHAIWTTCRPSGLEDAGWACGAGDRSATCISLWQCTIMSISVSTLLKHVVHRRGAAGHGECLGAATHVAQISTTYVQDHLGSEKSRPRPHTRRGVGRRWGWPGVRARAGAHSGRAGVEAGVERARGCEGEAGKVRFV